MKDSKGYTLVETIVSLALFVSVLLPLISIVGNLTLDRSAAKIMKALQLAEQEMAMAVAQRELVSETVNIDNYIVERVVKRKPPLAEVSIHIASIKQPEKKLSILSKTILIYD